MKRIPNGRRLKIGDKVYCALHPEYGECTIVEILRNVNAGCYLRTFYRLAWSDMGKYEIDIYLFQELVSN